MDYRIINMRTCSFLCVNIHTGVGHTYSESTQHFDSEKLSIFFLVLLVGFEPCVFGSGVLTLYPLSHPVTLEVRVQKP